MRGEKEQGVGLRKALDFHPCVLLAQQGLMHSRVQYGGREVSLLGFDD